MFFTNMILYDLCVFATLRAKFHAKAQRRKVYCHYLDCWYELRTVILYYIINEQGTGTQPTAASNVTVAYKGYFTNGNVFDQSKAEGISFGLNQVIKGWTEGIPYFKTGGSGVLLIPSHLGYGSTNNGPIPGGSVLIFDVKLISVN